MTLKYFILIVFPYSSTLWNRVVYHSFLSGRVKALYLCAF